MCRSPRTRSAGVFRAAAREQHVPGRTAAEEGGTNVQPRTHKGSIDEIMYVGSSGVRKTAERTRYPPSLPQPPDCVTCRLKARRSPLHQNVLQIRAKENSPEVTWCLRLFSSSVSATLTSFFRNVSGFSGFAKKSFYDRFPEEKSSVT